MTKIQIILGSTREGRFGEKPARWIYEVAKKRKDVEVELLDLRDYPLPFFNESVSPASITTPYTNPNVVKWEKKVAEADAYIIVTPEYNHGYPAVLKNALDYAFREWNDKPVGFVAYGGMGGARAVEQLKEVAVELHMASVRTAVHIPAFWTLVDEKGNLKTETLEKSAEGMLDQLIAWAQMFQTFRNSNAKK